MANNFPKKLIKRSSAFCQDPYFPLEPGREPQNIFPSQAEEPILDQVSIEGKFFRFIDKKHAWIGQKLHQISSGSIKLRIILEEGVGGSSRLGQNPKKFQKSKLKAPHSLTSN